MFIDIKERLEEEHLKQLLEYCVFPDPDKVNKTIEAYRNNPELEVYGYMSEDEIIGIVGIHMDAQRRLELKHIAVHPEIRGMGYGRGLLLELIAYKKPRQIAAETDQEAVDFYRNIGFSITSLGEQYPGVERFQCMYVVEEED